MNIKNILPTFIFLGIFNTISAQTVDELFLNNVKAIGEKTDVNNIKILKITQTGTSQGMNMPITTILMPGKAYYQKINTPMGRMISCVYENKGWSYVSQPQSRTTDLPEQMTKSLLIQSKYYGPLYDYYVNDNSSDVKSIIMSGTENINREKSLTQKTINLNEVKVSASRHKIEDLGGKLIYNAYLEKVHTEVTTVDLLRKVPMVTIDAHGNVSIRGNSSIKVLINGHSTGILSTNQVLEQISPARYC